MDSGLIISLTTWPCKLIFVATSGLNISETKPDSAMVLMDSLWESAHGLSIGHAPVDVTRPDDVIMVSGDVMIFL